MIRGGVIHAVGVANRPSSAEVLEIFEADQRKTVELIGDTPLSELPSLAAWRRAFSQFGVSPTQYRNAAEALLRRLTKRGDLPSINLLVDLANLISIRYRVPVAVFDQRPVSGGTVVRFADGVERFTDLGSREEGAPNPGEVIFVDDAGLVSELDASLAALAAKDIAVLERRTEGWIVGFYRTARTIRPTADDGGGTVVEGQPCVWADPRLGTISQDPPEYLPGGGLGNLVDELHSPNLFVMGDMLGHVVSKLLSRHGPTRLGDHESLGNLAGFLIGNRHYGNVCHRRMGDQERLQFCRRYLESLVLDEFLETVDDEVVPFLVDMTDVARMEPSVSIDGEGGRFRTVEVSLHHLFTANPDLAVFTDVEVATGSRINDSALGIRQQ